MSRLFICPSCGEEIETSHGICPNCGEEIKTESTEEIEMDTFENGEVSEEWEVEEINAEGSEVNIYGVPSSKE